MSGVGTYGGYAPAIPGADYPAGPIAWNAGQSYPLRLPAFLYANDLNEQLSAAVSFLAAKPAFKGAQLTAQSIPNNTLTSVTLDTELADAWNMHSNSGDTSQVVVPTGCDGIWLVQGAVPYAAPNTTGTYGAAWASYNGTGIPGQRVGLGATTGTVYEPGVVDLIAASAGDYFQLEAWQVSGVAANTAINTASSSVPTGSVPFTDAYYPYLNCRWAAANNSVPSGVMQVPYLQGDGTWSANQPLTLTAPNPATWTNLAEATSSQLNNDILKSVLFLANVPFMRAVASGSPAAITSSSTSQVTGLGVSLDNWGTFASNTWTCPLSGLYLVSGLVGFPQQASAYSDVCYIHATISGVAANYPGSGSFGVNVASSATRVLRFSAGDTVQLYAFQNSGSTITPQTGTSTRLITLWLSS